MSIHSIPQQDSAYNTSIFAVGELSYRPVLYDDRLLINIFFRNRTKSFKEINSPSTGIFNADEHYSTPQLDIDSQTYTDSLNNDLEEEAEEELSVEDFTAFFPDKKVTLMDLCGIAPDITEGKGPVKFIREIRDRCDEDS